MFALQDDVWSSSSKEGLNKLCLILYFASKLNGRKDGETGKDMHLTSAQLVLRIKTDIDQAKEIRSWRGYRHAYSLKVRGQHTKTTGRAGKALGVKKKGLMARPGAAPPAEGAK